MPSPHVLFTFLLFGCAGGSFDSGTADSDADADTAADPDPVPLDPCDPAAVFTGAPPPLCTPPSLFARAYTRSPMIQIST